MKTLSVFAVALHPEGVDRNLAANPIVLVIAAVRHPPAGGARKTQDEWAKQMFY